MHPSDLTDAFRAQRLTPPGGRVDMVLDTDTYNEIDDQFAVVQCLLSPDRLNVLAFYAAPFHNRRSDGPRDGMERSYDEILRLLRTLEWPAGKFPVYHGSPGYLSSAEVAVESDAAKDLIARAMARDPEGEPLYVVAIGAPTNVASAIILEPAIRQRIVVVWLGGHALHWPNTGEFNLRQDPIASHILLDSGVPLVLLPCMGCVSNLHTTIAELNRYVRPCGKIGEYLTEITIDHSGDERGHSKVIWDIAAVAWLLEAGWLPSDLRPSPILTDDLTWSEGVGRHLIRVVHHVNRDGIFGDLFAKLAGK